jgi:hypothetical protein
MPIRNSTRNPGCQLKLAASIAALAHAGLMSAAMAMPVPTVAGFAAGAAVGASKALPPVLYLAQNANDGYAGIPHMRPKPEVPANRGSSAGTSASGSAPATQAPKAVRPATAPAPRDGRDSDRK